MKKITYDSFLSKMTANKKAPSTNGAWALFFLPLLLAGCLNTVETEPEIITEPPISSLISTDTIKSGDYKTFTIGANSETVYESVNELKSNIGLEYINIVSNIYEGVAELEDKLPLYHYIFMDEKKGTSSGVQIGIKNNSIETIYLSSGQALEKWPQELSQSAIKKGDDIAVLYDKLKTISENEKYKSKFEAINLLTKDLSKTYDSEMEKSPQWYFGYTLEKNKMDVVKLNFEEGVLESIIINHYQSY